MSDQEFHLRKVIETLERENAALKADKERLVALLKTWYDMAQSCHLEQQEVGPFVDYQITAGMMTDTKEAISAFQKGEKR